MGQGQDVLFVDDEALILNAVVPVIEGLNYRVTACGRPDAALELFRAQPQRFALVVTDLTMPGMTGMELAWSMRQIRADVPIVLTSGGGRGSLNAGAATALGFRGFLPKPYRRPELAQVLATVLASPQPAASSPQPG